MTASPVPIAAFGVALIALWFYTRRPEQVTEAEGEASQEPDAPGIDLAGTFQEYTDMLKPTDVDQAEANTTAFLMMIRTAEGTAGPNGYRTMFGGQLFDDFSDHPRRAKSFVNKAGERLWTSAAGAYQFMAVSPIPGGGQTRVNTWDVVAKRLGLPDFSPESQDLAAIELIREAGALSDVRAGRFEQAVNKVRRIWASMPGAGYAQPEKSMDGLRVVYLNNGGTLA